MHRILFVLIVLNALIVRIENPVSAQNSPTTQKRIVFLAGKPSHGYAEHEHYAGSILLAKNLDASMKDFDTEVVRSNWPADDAAFKDVAAVVMYCDGGGGHPVMEHLKQIDALADKGIGIVCIHYGVEIPKGEPGNFFLKWIGGYFEADWSVNPHWKAEFTELPDHPITRGVKPFAAQDEWYYHMRFRPDMKGVTPILSAIPPASTLERPDGPHSGNPHVRAEAGKPQHLAWAAEREGGGRGFGFTGGHFHWNWGNPDVRRLMLNAIVWTAHGDVPEHGVGGVEPLTVKDLQQNQDETLPDGFNAADIQATFGLEIGK